MASLFTTDPTSESNYIKVNDGSSLTGWTIYNDGGVTPEKPIDGTGGASTLLFAPSASTAIRGNSNFLLTKSASNQQGQGISYLCNINPADRGKVLRFNFEYLVASGTYSSGDLTVWFYDVTNPSNPIIQGSPTSIQNSQLIERFQSEVQIPINCAQMRVIIHVSTATSAVGYTMRFDNFSFGPSEKLYSGIQTDWVDFPSVSAGTLIKATTTSPTFGTVSLNKAQYRRIGQNLEIMWDYRHTTAGGAGSGAYLFDISQLGLAIDTSKATATTGISADNASLASSNVGTAELLSLGLAYSVLTVHPYNSTQLKFSAVPDGTAVFNIWSSTFGNFSSANVSVTMRASVPIVGWSSSSQVVSDNFTQRPIAAKMYRAGAGQTLTSTINAKITLDTALVDSGGSFDSVNSRFVAKTPGFYRAVGQCTLASATTVQECVAMIYVNGVETSANVNRGASTFSPALAENITYLNAGDYIELYMRVTGTGTLTVQNGGTWTYLLVDKISGPSQVLASETVACAYYCSTNNVLLANNKVNFDSKDYDSHNMVVTGSGWYFKPPVAGLYEIIVQYRSASAQTTGILVWKNGSALTSLTTMETLGRTSVVQIPLLSTDQVDIRPAGNNTFQGGLTTADSTSKIFIRKVGNYV